MSACGGIGTLVAAGDLYAARRAALDHCARSAPGHTWLHQAEDAAAVCVAAWRAAVDALHEEDNGWAAISDAHRLRAPRVRAIAPSMRDCATHSEDAIASWGECCSAHVRTTPGRACSPAACCTFGNGTKNYLALPLLREVSISLALPSGDLLTIEQARAPYPRAAITVRHHHFSRAGRLPPPPTRAFCPLACWVPPRAVRRSSAAMRLMARQTSPRARRRRWYAPSSPWTNLGVAPNRRPSRHDAGAPSLAAAACGARVLATDRDVYSLDLIAANSALNGLGAFLEYPPSAERGGSVHVARLDWDESDVLAISAAYGPFDAVLGAALRPGPGGWATLWAALGEITRDSAETDVILAHTAGVAEELAGEFAEGFDVASQSSGLEFGMSTRWSETESDFEVIVLRRRPSQPPLGASEACQSEPG